jgi:hypothetical protein
VFRADRNRHTTGMGAFYWAGLDTKPGFAENWIFGKSDAPAWRR